MAEKYLDKEGLQILWSKIMQQIDSINSNISTFATQAEVNDVSSNVTSLSQTAATKALATDVAALTSNVTALSNALSNYVLKSQIHSNNLSVTVANGTASITGDTDNTKIPQVKVVANAVSTLVGASNNTSGTLNGKVDKSAIATSTTIGTSSTTIPSSSAVKSNLDSLTTTANGKMTKATADATYAKKTEVNQLMEFKGSDTIANVIAKLTASGVSDTVIGDVYNINEDFTVTNSNKGSFLEYKDNTSITSTSTTHIKYPAGTNVVIVKSGSAYYLDILTGSFAFETITAAEINNILS